MMLILYSLFSILWSLMLRFFNIYTGLHISLKNDLYTQVVRLFLVQIWSAIFSG